MIRSTLFMLLFSLSSIAGVSSLQCNLPAPPNDAAPALVTCLATYGAVELVGFYRVNTTIVMPQGSVLTSRGTFNAALTAGPSLTGPVFLLANNVSTTVEGIQIILPAATTADGAILVTATSNDAQYNTIASNYIIDEGKGLRNTYGIKLSGGQGKQIAFNTIRDNTVFQFKVAIHTLGATSNGPVTANSFRGNRTSAAYANLLFEQGTQQSTVTDHFCNGYAGVPSPPTCLIVGNLLPWPPNGPYDTAHEISATIHSDMTGTFGQQGRPYLIHNGVRNLILNVFSSDGFGVPQVNAGLPTLIGTNSYHVKY